MKEEQINRYKITHKYLMNKDNYLIIESDMDIDTLSLVIGALEFKFEDLAGESNELKFIYILELLEEFYKVKKIEIINIDKVNIENEIELYSLRESLCGPNYNDLYKYLVDEREIENRMLNYIESHEYKVSNII